MSTSIRRPLAEALKDAQEFRALFPAVYYERWEIAGSVRRGKADIGDIEHVVVPVNVAAFWSHVDALTYVPGDMLSEPDAPFRRHVYPNDGERWGDKVRGVSFRDFAHEIFLADKLNFGSVLALKTGPADYSKMLVTEMLARGRFRQQGGYVRYTNGKGIRGMPTEEEFFAACGVAFVPAAERGIK